MFSPVGDTARMMHKALQSKLDEEACAIEHKAMAEQVTSQAKFDRTSDSDLGSGETFHPAVRRQ